MKKREKRKLEKSCESYGISSGTTEKGEISMGTKAKKKNDFLDEKITQALAPYPDPMCRSEFREACHIGTRIALYLLHSGLIPFVRSGKKTQPYQIAKRMWPLICAAGNRSRNITRHPAAGTKISPSTRFHLPRLCEGWITKW